MTDKELGEALLKWDAREPSPTSDPRQQVAGVLRRDRRRIRWLAAVTLMLWLLAAAGIPVFFAVFLDFVFPKLEGLLNEMITHRDNVSSDVLAGAARTLLNVTTKMSVVLVTGSVIALLLAAGCTVWLVFVARRATLRQVNNNLATIAEEMKRLQPQGKGA